MTLARTALHALICGIVLGGPALALDDAEEAEFAVVAPHSLLDAVRTVAADASGPVYDAAIETQDGRPVYEIGALLSGKAATYVVDPRTGRILNRGAPGPIGRATGEDGDGADRVGVPLADAIASAEQAAGGRAMEAELERDDDGEGDSGAVWQIRVASSQAAPALVAVDADTGDVLATGPADDDDSDDD